MLDFIIKNGRVIDGTGAPSFNADIAVKGDRIVAIGEVESPAAKTLDARGQAVAPGFIDLHSHSDFQFFVDPTADSKLMQGVTLELVGNCGISFCAPLIGASREDLDVRSQWYKTDWNPDWTTFAGYLDALDKTGKTINIATQVGHGTVRKAVLGMETRAPDAGELKRMQALVDEALEAGAVGFSSGLSMAPGIYSTPIEVIALAEPAGRRSKLYSTHARDSGDEGVGLFVATAEAIEIGRRTGVKVQVSHLKCNGSTRGRADELLAMIESARKEGLDVASDQYPYIAASGPMSGNVYPRWALEGGRQKALERAADADLRAEIRAHLTARIRSVGGPEKLMVASYPPEKAYEGQTIPEIADQMGCGPEEALVRLFEKFDTQLILSGMALPDVEKIAAHPMTAVASDGMSLKSSGPLSSGNPHPRSYGTFPRFFAEFVRKKKVVSLEEAVRKMTTLPAQRLGLSRRGRIAPGYFADLVVFDPDRIEDRATFSTPHQYSAGISDVFVNGVHVVTRGVSTGKTAGRTIRNSTD